MARTFDVDELKRISLNHAVRIKTYNNLIDEIDLFSKTVEFPYLHVITKESVEFFSHKSFKLKKPNERKVVHRAQQKFYVPRLIKDYNELVCFYTLEAVTSVVQEEIRKNQYKLKESDLHSFAGYSNLFFKEVRNHFLLSPRF
jgi:hypothetical protein